VSVKVCILRTAGTNCDVETAFAFEKAGAEAEFVHINRLLEGEASLTNYQILAIPGGFTYGDDIAAGKILANELRCGLGDMLREFIEAGGSILGICNGFQVLAKTGLLPWPSAESTQSVTLTINDSAKFEDRWVYLAAPESRCIFTAGVSGMYLPVAHAEGKFVAADDVVDEIRRNEQVVFRYVNESGKPAGYPYNPNGSVDDIAGICDSTGRILGLMPHPERHVLGYQHPRWTREGARAEGDGMAIFTNAVSYYR